MFGRGMRTIRQANRGRLLLETGSGVAGFALVVAGVLVGMLESYGSLSLFLVAAGGAMLFFSFLARSLVYWSKRRSYTPHRHRRHGAVGATDGSTGDTSA
jgi:hypothetical protein